MLRTFSYVLGLLIVSSVPAYADQECDPQPYARGRIAAETACEQIANSFVPLPKEIAADLEEEGDPKICSIRDVVRCKRAMQDYLRLTADGRACGALIRENVSLFEGEEERFAQDVWREIVNDTCNFSE